ncbi:hypothetical protein FQR65_LT09860 [Abscondita terminalis]|nr:hypothetical protein FQR65_LT09860 [Abscondita terminalis]
MFFPKIYVVFSVIVDLTVCKEFPPRVVEEWINKTSSFERKCLPHDREGKEEVKILYETTYVEDTVSMCEYLKCMFEMLMFFGPNGEIMENVVMQSFSYMTTSITKKCANKAALKVNKCEKSYTFGNCVANELAY